MHRHTVPMRTRLAGVTQPGAREVALVAEPVQTRADFEAVSQLAAELARLVQRLGDGRKQVNRDVGQVAVELAIMVAERLLKSEIDADRQRLDRIVQEALARVTPTGPITLRANPADLALLHTQDAGFDSLIFQADEALTRGHLKLEAEDWFVEWSTSRSLADLREALLDETW